MLDLKECASDWNVTKQSNLSLQNTVRICWLDNAPNGSVDQSVKQPADHYIKLREDAGEGYVYVIDDFTGLHLEAE